VVAETTNKINKKLDKAWEIAYTRDVLKLKEQLRQRNDFGTNMISRRKIS
tara:strand:- start:164 stop:313 length:150 start_codon:yes stop_codon:yes gene_type:complete